MYQIAQTNVHTYSTEVGWEIAVFFFLMFVFTAFLLWANTRFDNEIDEAIRRANRGHVDPDDLTAALDFPRKQARISAAIKGDDK